MVNLKPLLFLAIAIGLYFVSHALEVRGDAAPLAENGVSPERAKYHLVALVLLLGALGVLHLCRRKRVPQLARLTLRAASQLLHSAIWG